ncbi:hypothetical protein LB505_009828 [Fusarium chuoi]|nr:hypothetical protein LB505_009828 [Fusarium chuoi]
MSPSCRSIKPRFTSLSPSPEITEGVKKADRACEKCTRTKKKCDKSLPGCSRCKRLSNKCCYDYVYTPSVTTVIRPEHAIKSPPHIPGTLKPFLDISSSMILSLLSSRNAIPSHSVQHYLETINTYLTIVHPELFALRTNITGSDSFSDQELQDPATTLLVVCMQLFSQSDDSGIKGEENADRAVYRSAKQILSVLRAIESPSIELIQCSILLAFYEYTHEDLGRAYLSIGDANTMALILHVGPGKYLEDEREALIPYEEEERRCVYWSLFVLDRLVQTDYSLLHMPHQTPPAVVSPPAADDLLPTNHLLWYDEGQSPYYVTQRYPADTDFSVPVGPFQRNCQYAMLYTGISPPQSPVGPTAFDLGNHTVTSASVLPISILDL